MSNFLCDEKHKIVTMISTVTNQRIAPARISRELTDAERVITLVTVQSNAVNASKYRNMSLFGTPMYFLSVSTTQSHDASTHGTHTPQSRMIAMFAGKGRPHAVHVSLC